MFNGVFYNVLSYIWIIIGTIYFIIEIADYKKQRKLGKLISKNKREYNIYIFNAIIFSILFVLYIISYINDGVSYSLIAAFGVLLFVIATLKKGTKQQKIFEKGIATIDVVLFWKNISGYKWIDVDNKKIKELFLITNYKVFIFKQQNKNFTFFINNEDIKFIKSVLDNNNVSKVR
jgi:predicted neutral ceramidase superfamily lipid hydrolase